MLQVVSRSAGRGAAALARPATGRHCRSPTPCWPRPLPDCLPPASVARRVAAILQHSPVREWWGARLARLTLVLFWRLVPLAFCVYLGDVDAGVVDLERELEPRASSSAANAASMDAKRAASSPAPTPASRSSSSSSSSASSAASPSASSASSNSSPATASSPRTPCATPASSPNASKDSRVEPLEPSEAAKQSQTRESLDASRRQSFSAMAADSRATMRRRSYDFTHGVLAHTPHGPPSPVGVSGVSAALRSMGVDHKGHLQHLRVYGRTNLPAAAVTASPTLAPSVATTAALPSLPARENDVQGEELVDVVLPTCETVWTRGKPVTIEWKVLDANVAALAIELLEDGSSATTVIARAAPNTGAFTYHRVPWGMASGSKYFLRVSAAGDPARFATTGFFAISSAP